MPDQPPLPFPLRSTPASDRGDTQQAPEAAHFPLIVGHLAVAGLTWELHEPEDDQPIACVDRYFETTNLWQCFVQDLAAEGYQITRTEENDR